MSRWSLRNLALLPLPLFVLLASASGTAFVQVRFEIIDVRSPRDSLQSLEPGDLVTIDVRMIAGEPPNVYTEIYGVEAGAYGFDPSVVEFVEGQAVDRFFWQACATPDQHPPAGGCFGTSITNAAADDVRLVQYPPYLVEPYVRFVSGGFVFVQPAYNNFLDPGLDGIPGGGDAQFRITFRMIGLGSTVIEVGNDLAGLRSIDGLNCCEISDRIALRVIPEPGTAPLLFMGMGLLAIHRRAGWGGPTDRAQQLAQRAGTHPSPELVDDPGAG